MTKARKQPEGLARARAVRELQSLQARGVRAQERIADALERMLAANARVMFFPKPSTRADVRRAIENDDDEG